MKKLLARPAILMLFLVVALSGCAGKTGSGALAKYNDNPLMVVIPPGLSPDVVEQVLAKVLVDRKWNVQSHSKDAVVATLKHRKYDATVTLQSDGSVITLLVDATLTRTSGPNAGQAVPAVPIGWLENLQQDIRRNFAIN